MHENLIVDFIVKNNINLKDKDIYSFGVYAGASMIELQNQMKIRRVKPHHFYGFDSFIGLPKEKEGIDLYGGHYEGNFNLIRDDMTPESIISAIKNQLVYKNRTTIEPGFFSDTLNDDFALTNELKQAAYIEIDCDLYISTIQVLEFMHKHNLIINNTIMYFDDWGGVEEYKGGESLAWREFIDKYHYNFEVYFDLGDGKPHRQIIIIIKD